MKAFKKLRIAFLLSALLPALAHAQVITIGFGGSISAVPISPASAVIVSLALAFAAVLLMRRRSVGGLFAAMLSLAFALVGLRAEEAQAAVGPPTPAEIANFDIIGSSPFATGHLGFCSPPGGVAIFRNGTSAPITINSIGISSDGEIITFGTLEPPVTPATIPECTVSTSLAPGEECYVGAWYTGPC